MIARSGCVNEADAVSQLTAELRLSISQESYKPFSKLPSERELAKRFGCTRHAVRAAIKQLADEEVVRFVRGSGAFVTGPESVTLSREPDRAARVDCVTFIQRPWAVVGALRDAITGAYLAGYTHAFEGSSARMRFVFWNDQERNYNRLLGPGLALERQACILVDVVDAGLMGWLTEQGIPYAVQYFTNYRTEGLPEHHSVFQDKVRATCDMTGYLAGLGHRRIGFIGVTRPRAEDRSLRQFHGYTAGMTWAGLNADARWTVHVETEDGRDGLASLRELLESAERPTAIIAQTDSMALTVLETAQGLGLGVPSDLSVVGFNDQAEAGQSKPPLTTVTIRSHDLAKNAAEIVFGAAEGRFQTPQTRRMTCSPVVRESTGPAPG